MPGGVELRRPQGSPNHARPRRPDRREQVHRELAVSSVALRAEIAEAGHHGGHGQQRARRQQTRAEEPLPPQQPRRRHGAEQRERHGGEVGVYQQPQHLQHRRAGPEPAGGRADQPQVEPDAREEEEMPAERGMAEAPDPGGHRCRGERDAERRQPPPLPPTAQRPYGGHRLQQPGEPVKQPDAVKPLGKQPPQCFQQQCQRRDRIGEDGVEPALLGVEVGREGRRPAPGIGDEVALGDGMLRGIAHRPPGRAGRRKEEIHRERDQREGQAEAGGERVGQAIGQAGPLGRPAAFTPPKPLLLPETRHQQRHADPGGGGEG
jgi:hypothetical protein